MGQPASTALYGNLTFHADLEYYGAAVLDVIRPCDDGADNDGDGAIDYPDDPGCNWAGDVSEEFDCSDGLDNDWDGAIDYPNDPDCVSPNARREEISPAVPAASAWSRGAILAVLLASGTRIVRRLGSRVA